MSDYTKSTNFAVKDGLPTGNPSKIVKGAEIDTEFNSLQTSVNSKADELNPNLSGTVTLVASTVISSNGVSISDVELGYLDGVSSNIQTQINTKQATDATLTSIAALGTAADKIAYTTAIDTWAETPFTAAARSVLDDATVGDMRTTLGAAASGANSDITSLSAITSINGGPLAGMRNRLINGNFAINQRAVSGSVVLSAGQYGHDRFKAGAGGCTYTFATSNNITTLTISAGTLMQVIEGANLLSGTHTLSWVGTAQGRVDSGSYGASGIQGTAVGGTNQTCEWGTGTLSLVQYEPGTVATVFENRHVGAELVLCQRYYSRTKFFIGAIYNTVINTTWGANVNFPVTMRTTPTVTVENGGATGGSGTPTTDNPSATNARVAFIAGPASAAAQADGTLVASAEL